MTDELMEKAKRAHRFLLQIRNHRDVAGVHFIQDGLRIEIGVGHLYHRDLVVQVIQPGEMVSNGMSKQLYKILEQSNGS